MKYSESSWENKCLQRLNEKCEYSNTLIYKQTLSSNFYFFHQLFLSEKSTVFHMFLDKNYFGLGGDKVQHKLYSWVYLL